MAMVEPVTLVGGMSMVGLLSSSFNSRKQATFPNDLLEMIEQGNRSNDRSLILPSAYLEVVIERR
jgi:hypothetical protein